MTIPSIATRHFAIWAACAALVVGCGGGDTPAEQTPPAPPPVPLPVQTGFNMDAAFATLLQRGGSFELKGSAGGSEFFQRNAFAPEGTVSIFGTAYPTTRQTRTNWSYWSGQLATNSESELLYYTVSPLRLQAATGALTYRFVSTGDLPTNADVGQSGPYATGVIYDGAAPAEASHDQRVGWSVESTGDAGTAWACLWRSGDRYYRGDCLRIDRPGNILGARVVQDIALMKLDLQ